MKISRTSLVQWFFLGSLILCWFVFAPVRTAAQQGDKAVYTTGSNLAPSSAWVDASAFCGFTGTNSCAGTNFDFCSIVSTALTNLLASLSPAGGVVDARGVQPPPSVNNNGLELCSTNPFPSSITQANPYPITILLPPYTIQLSATWTIPNNVRLVGVGFETILLGLSGCCSRAMIEMGQPSSCTTPLYAGIAIEHLQLNVKGAYGGIENQCAGPSSYVNDVLISGFRFGQDQLEANALTIGPGATNSGPYTDIYVLAVPYSSCGGGPGVPVFNCVVVGAQTRGLHGITCLGSANTGATGGSGSAAIVVNASNNSIEDVHIESFYDGVQIGDTSSAVSNIFISNVQASTTNGCAGVINAVHVCGPQSGGNQQCPSPYASPITDVTMMGISNGSLITTGVTSNSIEDDQTGTLIQGCDGGTSGCMNPITSGVYILGRSDGGNTGELSRFAINPANSTQYGGGSTVVPTWGMGNTPGIQGMKCHTPGALLSYTGATGGSDSVYVCTFASGVTWQSFPP
jgi:hypothetical protein